MNKEVFYGKILENVLKEIETEKIKEKGIYNEFFNAITVLAHLKDEDSKSVIDRHYLKINMTLTDALLLCEELGVDIVEVVLEDYGMLLFYEKPRLLLNMLGIDFRDSIECSIYNGGHSILVHYIDIINRKR